MSEVGKVKEVGRLAASGDRVTDAPHEAASASSPAGSVPHGAWTPGPWRLAEDAQGPFIIMHPTREGVAIANTGDTFKPANGYHDDWYVYDGDILNVAKTDARIKERNANARLIAAAPDLYEAMAALERDGILGTAESNASGNPNWEFVSRRINAARAALSKAHLSPTKD